MDLTLIWFLLVGVLLIGYFVLDGFDFGRPAIEVVKAKLADPVPPRLVERAMGLRLLDDAGRFQEPKKP